MDEKIYDKRCMVGHSYHEDKQGQKILGITCKEYQTIHLSNPNFIPPTHYYTHQPKPPPLQPCTIF